MRNTPVDSLRLWKLWQTNVPYDDICNELKISKSQLFRMAKQRGLKHRPRPPRSGRPIVDPTPLQIQQRSAAIRAGWSPEEENSRRVGWKNRSVRASSYVFDQNISGFRMDS
jgi:hypothetical protein